MKRRRYLAAAGAAGLAGLAGCKGDVAPGAGRHLLGPDTDRRQVALASVNATPDDSPIDIDVAVTEPLATADQPVRIAVTTTNQGPERAISVAEGGCCLFNREKGGSDDPGGLRLYLAESTDHEDRRGDRWVPDASGGRGDALYGCNPRRYAGGSLTNEYELWDDYAVRGYFRPGGYRWSEAVQVYDDPRAGFGGDPDVEFVWGFSLDVTVPE
jgi:hypothetical protein